jgi:ABC-type multidrug transport system ATPase subunit
MIKFDNLKKTYKTKTGEIIKALDGFSLEVSDNEVLALAGINGAGKTTALKALFNLIKLDEGKVEVSFSDSLVAQIGFAPEIPDLPNYLSVKEVLNLSCRLSGINSSAELLDRSLKMFDLESLKDKLVSTLSKGNRQRLSLAAAVVYKPSIVVFDEPTSGLDPMGRKLIKSAIKQLKSEGHTILFTTHMLADLPELCDKIAVAHKGKIIFFGSFADFCNDSNLEVLEERFASLIEQGGNNV